jgi:hypothetical protein
VVSMVVVVVPLVGTPLLQLLGVFQSFDVFPVQEVCASARDSGKATLQPTTTAATAAKDATLRLTHLSLAAENSSARQGERRKPRPAAMPCHA